MKKNTAGQKWVVFAFDITNNQSRTGDAANITAKLVKDYGAAVALTDINPTEIEDGYYVFDLTQAETNADALLILPESISASVKVIGSPATIFTTLASPASTGDIPTVGAIADAVWDEATAGHLSAGSTGLAISATGVRSAVGLASANLDTQLSTIDTVVDETLIAANVAASAAQN